MTNRVITFAAVHYDNLFVALRIQPHNRGFKKPHVIPAQAGIREKTWMPAFAGMTVWISDTYLRGPVLRNCPKTTVADDAFHCMQRNTRVTAEWYICFWTTRKGLSQNNRRIRRPMQNTVDLAILSFILSFRAKREISLGMQRI
jgi:hypothetical protein